MDNPVFKLEGVVHERSAETLQDFEGPLDLILFLLSKNKIEIQDIPIAQPQLSRHCHHAAHAAFAHLVDP